MLRHRIVPHQKLPKLLSLGQLKINRLINFPRRKIHRPHQIIGAGCDVQIIRLPIHRQRMKLPSLPPIQQPKAFLVHRLLFEIDDPGRADILFHPGIFDCARINPEQPLSQITEGPMRLTLHLQNMIDLTRRQHTLLDQQFPDRNSGHSNLLDQRCPRKPYRPKPPPGLAARVQICPIILHSSIDRAVKWQANMADEVPPCNRPISTVPFR